MEIGVIDIFLFIIGILNLCFIFFLIFIKFLVEFIILLYIFFLVLFLLGFI